MDFDVAISTVDRQPAYIHQTVESLRRDPMSDGFPVRFVVDGPSADYLGPLTQLGQVECLDAERWKKIKDIPPEGRCLLNFQRVLGPPQSGRSLLALEDDVVFTSGWVRKLELALDRVDALDERSARRREPFVLALYAARPFRRRPVDAYKPLHFYGNQALFFSPSAREAVRHFILMEELDFRLRPADMMVKLAAEKQLVQLWACNPSLCQHAGDVSSLGLRSHRSRSFRP
jgi:hypothetical protein